jgi:acetolactate synthase-1/2/3 large subunit
MFRTQLAPYAGSMGYWVPAAVAAKAVHPERMVLSWNGDGCFLMNGQELATAVQYRLAIVFVVIDNGMYGTIRMHQERMYPGHDYGTTSSIPILRRWRARTAPTARRLRTRRSLPLLSSARSRRAARRSCI